MLATSGHEVLNPGAAEAFDRALDGALGSALFVDDEGRRIFTFASPVFKPSGPSMGAVMVSVDINTIKSNWPTDPSPVYFTNENGLVFVSNRSELTLTDRTETPNDPSYARAPRFPVFQENRIGSHDVWTWDAGPYVPKRALHLTQPLPAINMTGEIFVDLAPVLRIAMLQSAVAVALCLGFGTMLFLAAERRRALSDRLSIEAAANSELEARVHKRTQDLSDANKSLRREVREREDAETALRKAQADLVQAGKLSALGQMSAGISHELNQPLMAIRSFAENAELLLDRGKPQAAAENLSRISELARRMGRIIKNLRAFLPRQQREPIGDVDLVAVVNAVLELATTQIMAEGVRLIWEHPEHSVIVLGGEVRLQQVVMNLVSNALDTMASVERRALSLRIEGDHSTVHLVIHDGVRTGIADPGKILTRSTPPKRLASPKGWVLASRFHMES